MSLRRWGAAFCIMPPTIAQLPLDMGEEVQRIMRRFYPLLISRAFGDASAVVGATVAFDLDNPAVQKVLKQLAQQVKGIAETTRTEIQDLLGTAAKEGWSNERLANEIRAHGATTSATRAETIARTESAAAYSKGSILAYRESGVVDELDWLSSVDEKTSPICIELDGKRVKIGEEFAPGIEHPPAHPNCRSVLQPVVRK